MTSKYQLDWKIKLLFWLMRGSPPVSEANYKKFRARMNSSAPGFLFRHTAVAEIDNRSIPGRGGNIPVRIYRPVRAAGLPVIVFFHGGGFVTGGLESHDAICRRIASDNMALVVAVDYRLAPENKYPAAVEDAYDAVCWTAEHAADLGVDSAKLIVMGDSAGGTLSAVVSLMARDLGAPRIAFQVLIYPAVHLGGIYPSKEQYDDTPVLLRQSMTFYTDQYIRREEDLKDAYVSPMLADDFSRLPPALILAGEYDPLRDENQAYADRLREAGNEVTFICYRGMVHGFLSFGRLTSQSDAAFTAIRQAVRGVIAKP